MKLSLSIFCAFTLAAVLCALAIARRNASSLHRNDSARTFFVLGEIQSIDAAGQTVRIAHQEIPNYMPAMTMPFPVKERRVLKGFAAGDQVEFVLKVTDEDSWISGMTRVQSPAGLKRPLGGDQGSWAETEAEPLQAGETVPDFSLVDQNGRVTRLSNFRGKAVVLTFIYTRCPLPNFCPLMSKNFAALQARLNKDFPNRYHLLSISIDPAFDHSAVLKEYAARYDADEAHWTFATGTEEQIHSVATLMGLHYQPENGLISHDLRTALIGPDGRLMHVWKSNVWTPFEVQRKIGELFSDHQYAVAR